MYRVDIENKKLIKIPAITFSELIDAFAETVGEKFVTSDNVQFVGLGTFLTRKREARQGRNPATGEAIRNISGNPQDLLTPCWVTRRNRERSDEG